MNEAIAIDKLCKHYKNFSLRDISFTVPYGSIMGFIGENGAGKTTTLKAVLGLLQTDGGSVQVLGKNPLTQRKEINTDVGAVLDGSFFYEGLRAQDVSRIMAKLHPQWDDALFSSYCKRFSLPTAKPMKEYSKGMRAKLALTTALSHHPKLLVMDEATSGLDPVVRSEMLDIFQEFIEDEAHTILMSSHITSDLEKIADYITFIHDGQIVFSQTKDDMLEQYGVVKCARDSVAALTRADIVSRRDSKFDVELLVRNAPVVRAVYPNILLEGASIDDIMTFFAREAVL
ncbi:MAG: ABC transporter ATP-binding protein [Ruthenibacterium sp.]